MLMLLFIGAGFHPFAQRVYNPAASPFLDAVACGAAFAGAFACTANPAAVSYLNGIAAGGYIENKYLISGLNVAALAVAYGKKDGGAVASIRYFGNAAYRETHAALGCAKNLGNVIVAASFHYNRYSITGFTRMTIFSFGAHSIMRLSDKFYASIAVINPPIGRFRGSGGKQNSEYRMGFTYEPSVALSFSFEFQKIENIPMQVRSVLQYQPASRVFTRIGVVTNGPQPFIGIGWMRKDIQLQLAIAYHPALGTTPGMLLQYQEPSSPETL